ncbi:Protein MIS12 [Merluccius polli]|uniref:Protein MIS12 homolog n=1 Tax=Merluccius polli TaxID=89951 RepID=A0AA47P830_MERPO|nr:Protein MIS12 [Merluccius polli]
MIIKQRSELACVSVGGCSIRTHYYEAPVTGLMRVESSLAALQRAYEAELCARQALLVELEEQKEVQEQLEGILRWVGELQAAWLKEGLGNFNDSFPMVMKSVKKLQDAVGEICNKARFETDA